jgi:CRISPR/Cas system Type II protein with McrA/HNH and RuvC-like nuclease domain
MISIENVLNDDKVKKEYRKALLLNMFKKLVQMMNCDEAYRQKVKKLYSQSTNCFETTLIVFQKQFSVALSDSDSELLYSWINAYFLKKPKRKAISLDIKSDLLKKQNGKCAVCGGDLGKGNFKVHIDHIVPWTLVGDELNDNYQALCEFCNECKSSHVDYIFKQLLHLN